MGLTCCSLKIWTTIAVFFTILNFLVFTSSDVLIVLCLKVTNVVDGLRGETLNNLIDGFNDISIKDTLLGILLTRIGLRILILISHPTLFIGNQRDRRKYLIPWEILVASYIIVLISSSTYFLIIENKNGFLGSIKDWITMSVKDSDKNDRVHWARLAIYLNLIDGGLIILWLIFILIVHLRGLQIKYEKAQLKRYDGWDTNILTYRIPRARLNSLGREDLNNTLEMRTTVSPVYSSQEPHSNEPRAPYYDNLAFKY